MGVVMKNKKHETSHHECIACYVLKSFKDKEPSQLHQAEKMTAISAAWQFVTFMVIIEQGFDRGSLDGRQRILGYIELLKDEALSNWDKSASYTK